jgi:hypothetical protein
MPIAKIQLDDGRIARFEVPDGTTQDEVIAYANEHFSNPVQKPEQLKHNDPTEGMSPIDLRAAGAGKALYDMGRGAGQVIRSGLEKVGQSDIANRMGLTTDQDIAESRRLDAPLMANKQGMIGNIAGNVIPMVIAPGGNTLAGSGALGAISGALQPTTENESWIENTLKGAGSGMAGYGAAKLIGRALQPVRTEVTPEVAETSTSSTKRGYTAYRSATD